MIDWQSTKQKYGEVDLDSYRPKIIVKCDNCGKISDFTIRVKSRMINNNIDWLCYKCTCNRNIVKSKHSKQMRRQWGDPGYKAHRSKFTKTLWEDLDYQTRHSEAVGSKDNREKCSLAARNAWNNTEYRNKHAVALAKQLVIVPNTEQKFIEILDSRSIKFEKNVVIGPYTFDFAISRPNKPTLLVEINGNYWHTRPYVAAKDLAKSEYIKKDKNYELKAIWEHQLFDVKRVSELLDRWLGLDNSKIEINLNSLIYKVVDYQSIKDFFCNYHYLGSAGRSGLCIAGYHGEILVVGMILAHPTRKESYATFAGKREILELTRFCISPNYHNKNLASNALAKIKKFIPKEIKFIISYADSAEDHSGTIYKASGWKLLGETEPSYFYLRKDGWRLHKKTLYNQARAAHLTEAEFVNRFKYIRVETPMLKKYLLEIG